MFSRYRDLEIVAMFMGTILASALLGRRLLDYRGHYLVLFSVPAVRFRIGSYSE